MSHPLHIKQFNMNLAAHLWFKYLNFWGHKIAVGWLLMGPIFFLYILYINLKNLIIWEFNNENSG